MYKELEQKQFFERTRKKNATKLLDKKISIKEKDFEKVKGI